MTGYQIVLKAKIEAEGFYEAVIRAIDKGGDPSRCKGFIKTACDKGVCIKNGEYHVGVPVPTE